jgi:hypothetical protein
MMGSASSAPVENQRISNRSLSARDFSARKARRWPARPSRPGGRAFSPRKKLSSASIRPPSPPPWPA